jgi:thiol-disulfide isomerase/thioredoxin
MRLFRLFILSSLATLLFAASLPIGAAEERWLDMPSGVEIPVEVSSATSGPRLVWLPSEFGTRSHPREMAGELAARGLETWIVDLHAGYFVPVGRNSLNEMPDEDIAALVAAAGADGRPVILLATGRGAQLAIRATRMLQQAGPIEPPVQGLILFHPYLYSSRPQAGADAEYLALARAVNVPVYLIQPELSAKFWRLDSTAAALQEGGAEVYRHPLRGLTDGFHLRDAADLTAEELAFRGEKLVALIERAARLLVRRPAPNRAAALPSETQASAAREPVLGLRPLEPVPAPPLKMQALDGDTYALEAYRGEVVLLSFWASWCPPCVEELPSLNRLKADFGERGLRILSVDVGEPREVVEAFLEKIPVDFPVLHDLHGETVDDWKVYAYPTNYLIDRQGQVRYGHFGALDWNLPSSRVAIEELLAEPRPAP